MAVSNLLKLCMINVWNSVRAFDVFIEIYSFFREQKLTGRVTELIMILAALKTHFSEYLLTSWVNLTVFYLPKVFHLHPSPGEKIMMYEMFRIAFSLFHITYTMILKHIIACLTTTDAEWRENTICHCTAEWEIYHHNDTVQRRKLNHVCRL